MCVFMFQSVSGQPFREELLPSKNHESGECFSGMKKRLFHVVSYEAKM